MKSLLLAVLTIVHLNQSFAQQKYEPTWESLNNPLPLCMGV
ncbi:MAG TPA: hypothetical protein VFD56_12720 [Chitinophagaceae bacterium]|nr:hypothetical protein [Chitinophagaceae bacterium]